MMELCEGGAAESADAVGSDLETGKRGTDLMSPVALFFILTACRSLADAEGFKSHLPFSPFVL